MPIAQITTAALVKALDEAVEEALQSFIELPILREQLIRKLKTLGQTPGRYPEFFSTLDTCCEANELVSKQFRILTGKYKRDITARLHNPGSRHDVDAGSVDTAAAAIQQSEQAIHLAGYTSKLEDAMATDSRLPAWAEKGLDVGLAAVCTGLVSGAVLCILPGTHLFGASLLAATMKLAKFGGGVAKTCGHEVFSSMERADKIAILRLATQIDGCVTCIARAVGQTNDAFKAIFLDYQNHDSLAILQHRFGNMTADQVVRDLEELDALRTTSQTAKDAARRASLKMNGVQ